MRVIGYVREAPGPDQGESVFVQSERIRKWVGRHRCQLVAVCQDTDTGDSEDNLEGYRALLGIIATGHVDTVVIPAMTTLSADLIGQEIMLWDLRGRGVNVISADEADLGALTVPTVDPARMLIRDVLSKLHDYRRRVELPAELAAADHPDREVLIELIVADEELPAAQAS